jgi:RNA polymerase sigma factor (sigma-70 family)
MPKQGCASSSAERRRSSRHDAMNEADLERIVSQYGPGLRRLVAAWERNAAAREDLLQEILVALWRSLGRFRGECSERTFVYRVANNRILTHRFREAPQETDLEEAAAISDSRPTPEHEAEATQRASHLMRALHALPPAMRQVLTLSLEGLSRRESAEVLGITENNATVRLSRARAALKKELDRITGDTR